MELQSVPAVGPPVFDISDQRKSPLGKLYPDLMGPARMQTNQNKAVPVPDFKTTHGQACGLLTRPAGIADNFLTPIRPGLFPQPVIKPFRTGPRTFSTHPCQIFLGNPVMGSQRIRQPPDRGIGLPDKEQP